MVFTFSVEAGGHFYYRPPSNLHPAPRTRLYPAAGSPERAQRQRQINAARAAAAADQRAAGSGRRSTPRWRSGTAVGSSERAQRQWHRAAGAGGSVASPEHTQRQWQIAAPRCRDDGRRRTAGVERRQGRRSARSGSGRSTRCGTGTTVGTEPGAEGGRQSAHSGSGKSSPLGTGTSVGAALPELSSGRVAGARAVAAADRRAAALGRRSAPSRRSGRAVGSPESAQWQRQIDAPRDRDDGRRRTSGAEQR